MKYEQLNAVELLQVIIAIVEIKKKESMKMTF